MRVFATSSALLVTLVAMAASCSDDPAPGASSTSSSTGGPTTSGSSGTSNGDVTPSDQVDTTTETMEFGGQTRRYLLSKPKQYDAKKTYPLVLNFHGNPSKPEDELAAMPFHTVTKADAIVAYPEAANGSDWSFARPQDGNADMDWIKPLIEELAKKVSIDPKKVLGFGYSGGAYFLSQFACRVGGVLKMVAIVSGGAPDQHAEDDRHPNDCVVCAGGPIPTFIAHGEDDNSEVPFAGGDYARQCWTTTNECNADDFTDAKAPCKSANGCAAGKPVMWCPVPAQGHGPWQPAMQQSWDMFRALP